MVGRVTGTIADAPSSSRDDGKLSESFTLINQRALAVYRPDFGQAIYRDLCEEHSHSLTRDSLLALGLETDWKELVARAAHRIVEDKVLSGVWTENARSNLDDSFHDEPVDYEESLLPALQDWLQHSIVPVLVSWNVCLVEHLIQQIVYNLHLALGRLRARQLFDIISEFPQSSPALQDLIACSEQADIKSYVSDQLSAALQARLLHPGASTRDIIQFYTHLIRSLRFVDPTGVILSHVIGPVRSYLRARSDTIPVIVASILGQAGDFTLLRDMMRETADMSNLGRGGVVMGGTAADTSLTIYDDTADGLTVDIAAMDESKRMVFIPEPDEDWAPRPVDAGPDYRQSRKSDVIAIIVSIFDDEEGFIAALERSCAEQIIQVRQYDTSKEYETNENLKKRFGDASMGRCNVMLNDVKRSQRVDRRVHRLIEQESTEIDGQAQDTYAALATLHPLILSRQFWPLFNDDGPAPGHAASSTAQGRTDGSSVMFASAPLATSGVSASFPLPTSTVLQGTDPARSAPDGQADVLPQSHKQALQVYQDDFDRVVHGRKLRWLPGRDVVHLEVRMDDGRTLDEKVTPLQAVVVQMAAAATTTQQSIPPESRSARPLPLNLDDVAERLQVPADAVKKAMSFWTSRGVLAEVAPGSFAVVEHA